MKIWTKPAVEITEIRLARFRMYANPDANNALLSKNNQPS